MPIARGETRRTGARHGLLGRVRGLRLPEVTAGTLLRLLLASLLVGIIMAVLGIGQTLIIVSAGYATAFLVLAGIAAIGFAIYLFVMPETRAPAGGDPARNAGGRRFPSQRQGGGAGAGQAGDRRRRGGAGPFG